MGSCEVLPGQREELPPLGKLQGAKPKYLCQELDERKQGAKKHGTRNNQKRHEYQGSAAIPETWSQETKRENKNTASRAKPLDLKLSSLAEEQSLKIDCVAFPSIVEC